MVKKTAQMLQSVGTELAETELPNEIQATTILLSTHTDKKNKMKVNEVHRAPHVVMFCHFFFVCVHADDCLPVCVHRRTCWWLWVRAAGCWRASTSP